MSSPATAAFLAAWCSLQSRPVTLCKIEVTVPSAVTLYVATTECDTPDGQHWEPGFSCEPIVAEVEYLGSGPATATTQITLADRAYSPLTDTLIAKLKSYQWQGAAVTIYLWEQSLTSFSDALVIFQPGRILRPDIVGKAVRFPCVQDTVWDREIPDVIADKITYPSMPDGQQSVPVPIVTGDHKAVPLRSPYTVGAHLEDDHEDCGAGQGVVPMLMVDSGVGGADVKLISAAHEIMESNDRANGYSQFIVANQLLAPLDTAGLTETLGASESSITIDDNTLQAYVAVLPIDVRAGTNTASEPRRAMDPFDETSYATLDQGAGKTLLQLILPGVGALGYIESVEVVAAVSGDAGNGNNIRIRPNNATAATFGTAVTSAATTTTPFAVRGTWDTAWWTRAWDFGGFNNPAGKETIDIRVDFDGGATNKARVYWVALVVKYRPQQSVVVPGAFVRRPAQQSFHPTGLGPAAAGSAYGWADSKLANSLLKVIPSVYALGGQFYANLKGAPDDGSGTFSGSIAGLIERVPDTIHWYLNQYGNVASASLETDATDFGSFVLGRSEMKAAGPSEFKIATHVGELTTVKRVIQRICEQTLACVHQDAVTGLWMFHAWKRGARTDYDRVLSWQDQDFAGMPQVGLSSALDVDYHVRVRYAFDHFKGRTLFEAFVSPDGSTQGYNLPTTRDQQLVVTAGTNDALDWVASGATYADTLTAATYTDPMTLAAEARSQIRGHVNSATYDVSFGFSIKAGYNDIVDITVGGTPYAVTISPGSYNPESGSIEFARALNAAGTGLTWTCTYSHSTNKFTLAASGNFVLKTLTGANTLTSALKAYGWDADTGAVASSTAALAIYADRFRISDNGGGTMNWKWSSGASASTNAAYLLGFARTDSGVVANTSAAYARGVRETTASSRRTAYGPREPRVLTAEWIRDEASAQLVRDRLFDMSGVPATIRLASCRMPDIQLMRVIECSSDLDSIVAFPEYGSDGSWAGKPMRVLRYEKHVGPEYFTEVLAVAV